MTIKRHIFVLAIFFVSIFLYSFVWGEEASIVISEIGAYESSGLEWVEITNVGSSPVDMDGWVFWEADTNHRLALVQGDAVLDPGEIAIIAQNSDQFFSVYDVSSTVFDSSWGTLNEGGEPLGLKDSRGNFVEQFSYVGDTHFSLERINLLLADYTIENWREHPDGNSVGKENFWQGTGGGEDPPIEVIFPEAVITINTTTAFIGEELVFSGIKSFPNDRLVQYIWNFGDGSSSSGVTTTHVFDDANEFAVSLMVVDVDEVSATVQQTVTILLLPSPPDISVAVVSLVISEVYPVTAASSSEWVELYNPNDVEVSLGSYVIEDGASHTVVLEGVIGAHDFFVRTFSQAILNNGGDYVQLFYEDTLVDSVGFGSDDRATVASPDSTQTIVRNFVVGDEHVLALPFLLTDNSTQGGENSVSSEETPQTNESGGGGNPASDIEDDTFFYEGIVVINELVSDPADGQEEFVELFHSGVSVIDFTGWWLEDGSEAKTMLSGSLSPGNFFVIEKPKGNLNNDGDMLSLFSSDGTLIDKVTYGKWDDGNITSNADAPKDPYSLARKHDGIDSNYDRHDFVVTDVPTPGKPNVISFPVASDQDGGDTQSYVLSGEVVINEVFPNPAGDDSQNEFVEIKNIGKAGIDLNGWKIGDATKKRFVLRNVHLDAGEIISFPRSETGLALNNSGEEKVQLFSPNDILVDVIEYSGSIGEDVSFSRDDTDMSFVWSTTVTPGKKNEISREALDPVVVVDYPPVVSVGDVAYFDGSDSYDPDGSVVSTTWIFSGEQIDQATASWVFWEAGEYEVDFSVVDNEGNTAVQKITLNVLPVEHVFVGGYVAYAGVDDVIISEIFPNPEGSDDAEFVELFNPTSQLIDLSGLSLDDGEGGSRAYSFSDGTVLLPQSYLVFDREVTKIVLNNTFDSVRLLYPDGVVAVELLYDDVVEGASYVFSQTGEYCWSVVITPGAENICEASVSIDHNSTKKIKGNQLVSALSLAEVPFADIGDVVQVRGIVTVLPGVFSTQYFYITDPEFGGVQVYMYKKDFPDMSVGDFVEVTGEIRESQGERRIKIDDHSNIVLVGQGHDLAAQMVDIENITEEYEGWFLKISGEVTELQRSYMYIDDGTDEIKVYFKKGAAIPADHVVLGDIVDVVGILGQIKQGYQLLPRAVGDIVKTGSIEPFVSQSASSDGSVDADIAEKYLTATAGGLTSILFGLFLRARGVALLGLLRKTKTMVSLFFRRG